MEVQVLLGSPIQLAIVAESADALAREARGFASHESSSLSDRTNLLRTWRNRYTHLAQTQGRHGNVRSTRTVRTKSKRPWWKRQTHEI